MPNASAQSSNSNSRSYAAPGSGSSLVTGGSDRQKSGPLRHGDSVQKSSGPQTGGVTPMTCQNSGPLPSVLPATGLITSGPLNSCGDTRKVSGPLESAGSMKLYNASIVHSQAVSNPDQGNDYLLKGSLPKPILWSLVLLFVIGFVAGGFILAAVDIVILLVVVITIFGIVVVLSFWNTCFGRRVIIGFIARYPDADLRTAKEGQYVKVVTCGNFALESSYHKVPRCVYTSTCLYEYRGWDAKTANAQHRLGD